ncbi:hypothetical protein OIU85_014703 [Salix viminalis]|uniref:Uncharacterized protein n=1 Tax=Salix viminalis TaxID=40686 RepID=A0A9Q0NJ96_SALVM|nr:hypothetical protein OIU85_014703 [Salix viminalis]
MSISSVSDRNIKKVFPRSKLALGNGNLKKRMEEKNWQDSNTLSSVATDLSGWHDLPSFGALATAIPAAAANIKSPLLSLLAFFLSPELV